MMSGFVRRTDSSCTFIKNEDGDYNIIMEIG